MDVHVIIVAAGSGKRFGSEMPKQFLPLGGKPLLVNTIEAFAKALPDARITVVLAADAIDLWQQICSQHAVAPHNVAIGGDTRWQSVKNALDSLEGISPSATILIHDGARPLVTAEIIERVSRATLNTDGALPAIEVVDSLRRIDDNGVTSEAVDRSAFRAVQTPQGFKLWRLRQAYSMPYSPLFTDDASVMAEAGFTNIVLVEGSEQNIKVTRPIDMLLAEAIIANRS